MTPLHVSQRGVHVSGQLARAWVKAAAEHDPRAQPCSRTQLRLASLSTDTTRQKPSTPTSQSRVVHSPALGNEYHVPFLGLPVGGMQGEVPTFVPDTVAFAYPWHSRVGGVDGHGEVHGADPHIGTHCE